MSSPVVPARLRRWGNCRLFDVRGWIEVTSYGEGLTVRIVGVVLSTKLGRIVKDTRAQRRSICRSELMSKSFEKNLVIYMSLLKVESLSLILEGD